VAPLREESPSRFSPGDSREDQRRTESLLAEVGSISERVSQVAEPEDLDELLIYIVDASIARTGAERGMLVLDHGEEEFEVRVARQRGGAPLGAETRYSTSAVRKVLETGEPLKDMFNSSAEAMDLGASVFDLKLRALMCVPLEAGEGESALRGVLYVDSKAATREFDSRDLSYFSALSVHIAQALRNVKQHLDSLEQVRIEQMLELARIQQGHLMRQVPADFPGFDYIGWYRPAERTTGDFYDFFKVSDGRLAVVVGDVTGHGFASALITHTAQGSIRSTLRLVPDLCKVVTGVNQDLAERMDDGNFVTLFVALLSPDGEVTVLNAGHTPPQVFRSSTGEVTRCGSHGPALGMMADFAYEETETFQLGEGDVLLAFTDGITEARDLNRSDVLLGEDGLEEMFREQAPSAEHARGLTDKLVAEVLQFAKGNCEDDMTMVAVRRTSG
jgi:phosphoserine phosphatase RsbU/P